MTENPCDSGAGLTKDLIMKEFKAGDKVYYPIKSTKVLTIRESTSPGVYSIFVSEHALNFTTDGKLYTDDVLPSICHATPENHELLCKLYGVEFEAPPVKPTSKDIIQAMLDRGDKYVPCWVSIVVKVPSFESLSRMIYRIEHDEITYFIDDNGDEWEFATPFDPRTGDPITELPT